MFGWGESKDVDWFYKLDKIKTRKTEVGRLVGLNKFHAIVSIGNDGYGWKFIINKKISDWHVDAREVFDNRETAAKVAFFPFKRLIIKAVFRDPTWRKEIPGV
jgi:hypothetical protein